MIDTQAIRSKILDLAMRGQLTEQLTEDGTAEELYQQILEEKQKLIKEGKIKKQKPLPEITDEEIPFDIPKNWKWVRWGTIAKSIQYGYNAPALPSGIIKMVRISDIQKGQVIWDSVPYCEIQNEEISAYLLEPNDILFARTGGTVGKSYLVSVVPEKAIYAGYLVRTQYSNSLCPKYLKYFMESALYWSQLRSGTIATAQPNCNGKTLSKMILPLPSTTEQYRIANKIDQAFSVLDTIDELQAKYADNLTALKSKLIDAAIRGKLTEQLPEDGTTEELYRQIQEDKQKLIKEGKIKKQKPLPEITDEEIPFDIPDNWKWVRLGKIATILGGKRIPAGRTLTSENTGHKYIRVSEMKNHTVITDNLLYVPEDIYPSISQYIISKEDVYITVAGTIGRVGKIPPEIDGANLTENADRIVISLINQDWLILCLSSSEIQKQIEILTTSVAQPKLAIKRIQEFFIPLPPLAEQKRIVQKLNEILPICEKI